MQLIPLITKIVPVVLSKGNNFTIGPEDTIQAGKMVQTKMVIGIHYDTFGFIKIDH